MRATTRIMAVIALMTLTACAEGMQGGLLPGQNAGDARSRLGNEQGNAGRATGGATAMLESIAGVSSDLDAFDYLEAGQTITLGARGQATISYFETCRVEQIRGGQVTVGTAESRVAGGQINARTMACKGNRPVILASAREAGAGVNRAFPPERWTEWTIRSPRPIFKWRSTSGKQAVSRVVITELEQRPGRVIWSGEARGSYLPYPASAPGFSAGMPYEVRLEGPDGGASTVYSIDPRLDIADTPTNRVVFLAR